MCLLVCEASNKCLQFRLAKQWRLWNMRNESHLEQCVGEWPVPVSSMFGTLRTQMSDHWSNQTEPLSQPCTVLILTQPSCSPCRSSWRRSGSRWLGRGPRRRFSRCRTASPRRQTWTSWSTCPRSCLLVSRCFPRMIFLQLQWRTVQIQRWGPSAPAGWGGWWGWESTPLMWRRLWQASPWH